MSRTPRTTAFKKKVVLDALREDKTLAQIASEYGVHPMLITKWKKQLFDGIETLFGKKGKERKEGQQEREILKRKIGQLTIELDFLKKNWATRAIGKTIMDRERPQTSSHQRTMRPHRATPFNLLLRGSRARCDRPY